METETQSNEKASSSRAKATERASTAKSKTKATEKASTAKTEQQATKKASSSKPKRDRNGEKIIDDVDI